MEESRKQFEAWFHSRYDQISMPPVERSMLFTNQWASWQASRAAIEIELPELCAWNLCELLDKKEVVESIRAAGLTVKGDR
ncbi:hypothetical protein [Atlantibacter hermannii]|uniref:hypothetical protein n=1 Tax=Atlantibacter hermannii TaxID=565 RepID=UPI0028B13B4B|nr:hypothetical protein [Atlantibacter hermannii]